MRALKIFLFIFFISGIVRGQDFPDLEEDRFVHDFVGILETGYQNMLEKKLIQLENETGVEIAIIVVESLNGLEPADYAQQIGEKWGVGKEEDDNGIVILVKPKYLHEKGEIFIATGYGIEGIIPDVTAKRIIEKEIIPSFKEGNYYHGLDHAIFVIEKLVTGELKADDYAEKATPWDLILYVTLSLIILIGGTIWYTIRNSSSGGSSSYRGSYSSHSSGSGGSSSSFSYGGGSFGGGGAGGSW